MCALPVDVYDNSVIRKQACVIRQQACVIAKWASMIVNVCIGSNSC